jgi:VTC domain
LSSNLTEILDLFQPITLAEMDGVQLMNRTDTKFMLNTGQLAEILPDLSQSYKALEVEGVRQSRYETLYYDTDSFHYFTQHQNGKRHRYKIRKREYVESNISFLEVKEKNNKGRTAKSRIRLKEMIPVIDEKGEYFISEKVRGAKGLEPKIWNSFSRTTLVDTIAGERVTLDSDLAFYYGEKKISLNGFVIAEVKQDGENRHSLFMQHMKKRLLRPEGVSKYCLGVALLYPEVKSNNFKEKILRINKITNRI